jgi:large subunit ribosomal protein L21
MYAIVEIAGQQFKVSKDRKIFVHRQDAEEGAKLSFDKVLLIDDENNDVKVGTPTVEGATIEASVISHVRGDKVLVFKKKRRKGYQKMTGHRQDFTQILINDIKA